MLQNGNNVLKEDWPSFCSSCKSDLRSFFSIGVPSYLNESVSNISNDLQDASQNQVLSQITNNNENKTMQSTHEIKICNWNKSSAYFLEDSEWGKSKDKLSSNSQLKSPHLSLKHTNEFFSSIENHMRTEENMLTNVILAMYKTRQLKNIIHKRLHGFINLKNRTEINNFQSTCQKLFENLKLLSSFKSCDFNTQNGFFQRLKSTDNMQNFNRLKEIRDFMQCMEIQATVSKTLIDLEMTEIDIKNRRRNVYKLAVQVAKLSAYIQSLYKFLLNKKNMDKAKTRKNNRGKDQESFKNNAIKSCINRNTPQDLSMYSYNPLRTKEAETYNK